MTWFSECQNVFCLSFWKESNRTSLTRRTIWNISESVQSSSDVASALPNCSMPIAPQPLSFAPKRSTVKTVIATFSCTWGKNASSALSTWAALSKFQCCCSFLYVSSTESISLTDCSRIDSIFLIRLSHSNWPIGHNNTLATSRNRVRINCILTTITSCSRCHLCCWSLWSGVSISTW